MRYLLAWPSCHCLDSAHISICKAPCLLCTATLRTQLSPHTSQPSTTANIPDPIRIQCCWWLAFEVDENVSLFLRITICQMAAAKTVRLCPRSLLRAKQLFGFELTDTAHRSLEVSDVSPPGGGERMLD